jgi:metallo-beta-lactamase class B
MKSFRSVARVLTRAEQVLSWHVPAEPTRIVGPIYFVGTKGLGVWLITTSEGHLLLNTGMPTSGQMIEDSISKLKLDLKPRDIKLLLTCHPHIDHVGGHAYIQKISGAQVAMLDAGVDVLQTGGKADFLYGRVFGFEPVHVDRVFQDGDTITVGDVSLTAISCPGHCYGATTFIMNVVERGQTYVVVFPDGSSVNPGYRVAVHPSYPRIGDDYRRTLRTLESLRPDIWLAPHNEFFDFAGKRARAATDGVQAWVDPDGYQLFVAKEREKFEARVNKEMGPISGR